MLLLAIAVTLAMAAIWEAHTSQIQSRLFARWSAALQYQVEPGPAPQLSLPRSGPFDARRGYSQLAQFTQRLQTGGFQIVAQARQRRALARLVDAGIPPPYREAAGTGLVIRDERGATLANWTDGRILQGAREVPPLLAASLLFIENRSIGEQSSPRANPAVDWQRSGRALLSYGLHQLGFDVPIEGGSTLATQLEKFRHSPGGRTASPRDKIRQMVGASLAAYHAGPYTQTARQQVIVDYLNTMPLGAAPGVGEVHGLAAGLKVWFGLELQWVRATLAQPDSTLEKARAYRHALALLYAVHAPTYYLVKNRNALEARIDSYAGLLRSGGVIDDRLFALMRGMRLQFVAHPQAAPAAFVDRKAVDAARVELARLLGVPDLYALDGLDLQVDSSIDGPLQQAVTRILQQLASPQFLATHGLVGPHLLGHADPRAVTYGFLLLEAAPSGNLVRVNTDTFDGPFNSNEGMKLELGSTAKLRTLSHYLQIMAELYDQLAPLDAATLRQSSDAARDTLTRWSIETLQAAPGLSLAAFLDAALARRYSASPDEAFFTGGGAHRFRNFEPADNGRILSVREALVHSTNLVFIRLMRDVVRFHEARLPYDTGAVLSGAQSAERQQLLQEIAAAETQRTLAQAYQRYRHLTPPQILQRLLGARATSHHSLAVLFYAWRRWGGASASAGSRKYAGSADADALRDWLRSWAGNQGRANAAEIQQLQRAYGNPHLTVADFAFLLRVNPLDLWCAGELLGAPAESWDNLLARSESARHIASAWLFKTRNRRAQDLRLRIRIERDAFARETPYWRALGFPFAALVPSYATAIGSSADRPAALAQLMGIIVNDGRRRPQTDIRRLTFAAGTPYHTAFADAPARDEQVMRPVVAQLLRSVLADVVERGTARRISHTFVDARGVPLAVGGKTGSGDNRIETVTRQGTRISSRAVNRTATFVFYLQDRWFGALTASVAGPQAAAYSFTSSLPLAVLKLLAPTLMQTIAAPRSPGNLVELAPAGWGAPARVARRDTGGEELFAVTAGHQKFIPPPGSASP